MEAQPIHLRTPIDPALTGIWRSEVSGTDLTDLSPVEPRFMEEIILRGDGTADLRWLSPELKSLACNSDAPFPIIWETSSDGMLSIYLPIAPMPEYEIVDWIQDAIRYDVLSIMPEAMTLSDRRYDGESITVFRRQNKSTH
ncbi:hypothetical protein SAMN05444166_2140 [Singulisphaera sp. GP187]|uniref:hypothetical protein n=1 Tax=Singulisphaera sp. GP187 TaxID=1882752 RepID=UPI00092921DB|nr:hypothetical protein [Singulisphaera sp. GP187]SIO03624.1 hypothetical protein SAMN05444166_2140 [Singulisphaera sp. GP187]